MSDGTLAFQMQRLAEVPRAVVVVVKANYPDIFRIYSGRGAWLADAGQACGALPEDSGDLRRLSKFAEEWRYRFLISAAEDDMEI